MKIKTFTYFTSLFLLVFLFSSSSCQQKGCTDKNAINYNSVADVDDGSCITCSSETDTLGTISAELWDNNFSSPHYNQNVATFYVTQVKNNYVYTECGTNNCYFPVKVKSLVNERMTFTFNLQASGNIFFNYQRNITIEGNETKQIDNVPQNVISSPCGFIFSTSLFVSTNGNIIYN